MSHSKYMYSRFVPFTNYLISISVTQRACQTRRTRSISRTTEKENRLPGIPTPLHILHPNLHIGRALHYLTSSFHSSYQQDSAISQTHHPVLRPWGAAVYLAGSKNYYAARFNPNVGGKWKLDILLQSSDFSANIVWGSLVFLYK